MKCKALFCDNDAQYTSGYCIDHQKITGEGGVLLHKLDSDVTFAPNDWLEDINLEQLNKTVDRLRKGRPNEIKAQKHRRPTKLTKTTIYDIIDNNGIPKEYQ